MTISGISSVDPNQATSSSDPRNTVRQLFSAIQSGDLSSAQQAYNSLTQGKSTGPLQSTAAGQDFTAIGAALQSGDITGAQSALTKLQDDLQAGQAHKHHHHHHHGSKAASSTDTSSTNTVDPTDPTSLIGSTLSVKA